MSPGNYRPILWRRLFVLAGLGIASMTSASCSKAQAKTPGPAPVALSVPEPPPRPHFPVSVEPPPTATETPAPPTTSTTRRPTPPTPTPTPPPNTETVPPPVVQTSGQAQYAARANEALRIATRDLDRVKKPLRPEAQDQFDSAKRFIGMAEAALTAKNFIYAAYCAEKAATLAALLVKE